MNQCRSRRRPDGWRQYVRRVSAAPAAVVAALAAAIALSAAADPAAHASWAKATSSTALPPLSGIASPMPAPAASDAPAGLTVVPDTVQSPWLRRFADRIATSPADFDTDECVHVEGYYSQAEGMQLEQVDSVLHPDTSADIITRRLPVMSHQGFAHLTVGEVEFRRARTTRVRTAPNELAFILTPVLPQDEAELFAAILALYSQGAYAERAVVPINVLDAIVDTAYRQVPRRPARAAMLRLLSRLPGIHVQEQAQDPQLQLMVAVSMSADGTDRTAYFSPDTGQLLAFTEITRSGYTPPDTKPPHLRQAILYRPGCAMSGAAAGPRLPLPAHRGLPRTRGGQT